MKNRFTFHQRKQSSNSSRQGKKSSSSLDESTPRLQQNSFSPNKILENEKNKGIISHKENIRKLLHLSNIIPKINTDKDIISQRSTISMFFKKENFIGNQEEKSKRKYKIIPKEYTGKEKLNDPLKRLREKDQESKRNQGRGKMLINELWGQKYYNQVIFNSEIMKKSHKLSQLKNIDNESAYSKFLEVFRRKNPNIQIKNFEEENVIEEFSESSDGDNSTPSPKKKVFGKGSKSNLNLINMTDQSFYKQNSKINKRLSTNLSSRHFRINSTKSNTNFFQSKQDFENLMHKAMDIQGDCNAFLSERVSMNKYIIFLS